MTLEDQFKAVTEQVKAGTVKRRPTQTEKLQLYAWYKQATEGDAPTESNPAADLVARAKLAAWQRVQGMSKEGAMREYVRFFNSP